MNIGKRVKQIRLSKGITGRQLAQLAQTSHGRIYTLEGGADNVTLRTLSRVAEALGVSLLDLVADEIPDKARIVAGNIYIVRVREQCQACLSDAMEKGCLEVLGEVKGLHSHTLFS